MAPGADKTMNLSPPGTIGLFDEDAVVLLRFNETATAIHPKDDAGSLNDLTKLSQITTFLTVPAVVDAFTGRGRRFVALSHTGLGAKDATPGASLLTRDVTIQTILSWNAAVQTDIANVVSRGLNNGPAADQICYGLELVVTSTSTFTGTMRMFWEDVGSVIRTDAGVSITCPPNTFTLLTATRRWVSPTSVVVRYYIGDLLLGENVNVFGSIGGGTTGTFQVGTRWDSTDALFFDGIIDEIMIVPRELTHEEVEATWLRLTLYQPLGHSLFVDMHDQGFPLSLDPSSDQALETRMIGHALGYAAAQIENFRANALPGRAYGSVLDDWETVTRPTPFPNHDIDTRRARVVARLRQRRGISIPGIGDALVGLLGGASIDDLEFIAFSNTIVDEFATIDPLRWDVTPAATWTAAGVGARSSRAAGTFAFAADTTGGWRYMQLALSGGGKQAHAIAKLAMTTPQANLEVGVFFAERAHGNFLLVGLRDVAGAFHIFTESFIAGVSQGAVDQATLGGNPAALWLHVFQQTTDGLWAAAWSVTAEAGPFTLSPNITHPTVAHWTGVYMRTAGGATAGASQVDVDNFKVRDTFGTRPFNAYVFLDSALGFSPDVRGAQSVLESIKHAYTHVAFITKRAMLTDDPATGTDLGPLGGY